MPDRVELCAPAGNLPSLKEAINRGADAVYLGFNNDTNLRNFPGLNFTFKEIAKAIKFAHRRGKKIYIAINSYPQLIQLEQSHKDIDEACSLGADALIISDLGLLAYASKKYPSMRLHLSVQAGASSAQSIIFYQKTFNVKRVVLPRVMSVEKIAQINKETGCEIEVFGFGLLCINYEGRCHLSSYLTGESINTYGACGSPRFVRFEENGENLKVMLGETCLNKYPKNTAIAYPTPCKGYYHNLEKQGFEYAFQNPQSLNVLEILPSLIENGADAIKIEGRQRSQVYVGKAVSSFRQAIDSYYDKKEAYSATQESNGELESLFEGSSFTCGCYAEE